MYFLALFALLVFMLYRRKMQNANWLSYAALFTIPLGYVASTVMLNAKLKPQMSLVHVVAMTRSLGLRQSKDLEQPEIFVWRDNTESTVTCEFVGGRLRKWTLERPAVAEAAPAAASGKQD